MSSPGIISQDTDQILQRAEHDLRALDGARLLITGGTGYIGTWLLESVAAATTRLGIHIEASILSRDPERFKATRAHLAENAAFRFIRGDVRVLPPKVGTFDGIIHAATAASAQLNRENPLLMLDTIVEGGRSVLEIARRSGAIPFLFTSSGAVYGPQPTGVNHLVEDYMGGPDFLLPSSAYHEGKRIGELQCSLFAHAFGIKAKIARIFAQVGPYLPLDRHFAMGNFILDGLAGRSITVSGDGTTVRSYLYATDMVVWLWAIFVRGTPLRPYNLGSGHAVDIRSLADLVAGQFTPRPAVVVTQQPVPGRLIDRYVPSTRRIRSELSVEQVVPLEESIARAVAFYQEAGRT